MKNKIILQQQQKSTNTNRTHTVLSFRYNTTRKLIYSGDVVYEIGIESDKWR